MPYLLLDLLFAVAFLLYADWDELLELMTSLLAAAVIAELVFLIWPTRVIYQRAPPAGMSARAYQALWWVD